jgi:glycine dehydrogenase
VIQPFFDTLKIRVVGVTSESVLAAAQVRGMNFRAFEDGAICISLDETTTRSDVELILQCFVSQGSPAFAFPNLKIKGTRPLFTARFPAKFGISHAPGIQLPSQ